MNPSIRFDADGDRNFPILWEDGDLIFCRGHRRSANGDWDTVLAVLPATEHPTPVTLDRLAHEYDLKDELDVAWAVRPLELVRERGRTMLVLEDPDSKPLERMLSAPLELGSFLRFAIGITSALDKSHRRGLVHKDIKPANILVNRTTGEVRLTGFGIASRLLRERSAPEPPETIAGTLAYMAPEQTGRMNRSIDSRSDLYALGVTFYQMLTGALPFTAADPMEWVHCHIARRPVPPDERLQDVPGAVSAIIMKLLAKTAEERYQTAAGVERDLRHCVAEWEHQHRIDDFPLGQQDTPDQLRIPEKLYGRTREVEALFAAFDRVVKSGAPKLVLVSGYSGIGKSSVVNELHKVLVPSHGRFASGKFDQYKRDIPYAPLLQALQGLVRPLLGQSDAELASWRDTLLEALGPNGGLMTELIPELKLIIGDQPPVPELEPRQSQSRFQLAFRQFIGVFARPQHPLVLFFDDLQWLDAGTLDLLEDLMTRSDLQHLLLIGAYRDNEVDANSTLIRKLEAIGNAGTNVSEIALGPLSEEHLRQLVADTLHCDAHTIVPLAQLVHQKTDGNPFFATQFLSALAEEGLLFLDHGATRWSWDLNRIYSKGYTDNVVDLMIGKFGRLPVDTQVALQHLACLGSVAAITMLSIVLQTSRQELDAALLPALSLGLVERRGEAYKFVHDRVEEAAYSLIPEDSRAEFHLLIGRVLLLQTLPERREEMIFEIVNQLNRGNMLMTAREEREQLAELNLIAGARAKAATAYNSALLYLNAGVALFQQDCWERRHELTFALELHRAECEFLTGALAEAEQRLNVLSARAASTVERATVASLCVDLYTTLDQSSRAIAVGLDYLRHLDIDWSPHPTDVEARREYERIWSQLGSRTIEDLIELPLMSDPASLATLEFLTKIAPPAFYTDANLLSLIVCRAVNLSIERGNSDASCAAYAFLGMIAGPRFGDYQAGYRFGRLGYDLVEERGLRRFRARVYNDFGNLVMPWTRHVRAGRDLVRRTFEAANAIGDLTYASYCGNQMNTNLLMAGDPLAEVEREAERGLAFAQRARFGLVIERIVSQLGLIRTLRGLTRRFGSFDEAQFDELRVERRLAANPDLALAEFFYWTRKLQARFFAGDYPSATEAASRAQRLLWVAVAQLETAEYHFYGALSQAATCDSTATGERQQHLDGVIAHHKQLQLWAVNCPDNFENRAALVGAEIARVEGRELDAERLYEQAIRSARANGFIHNEALANELAARFYAARGLKKIARVYLRDARHCYLRWGAHGKVRQLDELYPYLREDEPVPGPTTTIGAPVEQLDLATVIKVSQAVSGEIVLEKLLDTLMRTAMAQAGADRVLLILAQGASQRIIAEATTTGDTVAVHLRDEAVTGTELPESVLHYVLRTRESVILDDAAAQSPFAADPYIRQRQARSVLCLPLLNQAKLIGVLYLENNLAPRVFAAARLAVLKLLASQAAISLENTRLYRDLAEREAKVRRLVEANIIGIFIFDADGRIVEANDAFLQLVGYDREDFVAGRVRWADLTPPEWRDRHQRAVTEFKRTGTVQPYEREYFRKDGSRVPALIGSAAFDEQRDHGVAFVLDLTERKRAEEVARRSEKELRDVVNAVPAFVWSMLPDGAVDFVNDRWLEFTGLSPRDALGWNWEAAVHPDDRSRVVAEWREALKDGRPTESEMRVRRADGTYRWWFFRNLPLLDEAGSISKWYGTGIDIDDRKRTESLLALEKQILEMVAKGNSLTEILDSLCRLVEEQADGVLASILLLDGNRLRHGGAPSLPRAYTDAIDGAVIGPLAGSCGTAAYRGEPVIVEDIATDPLWADYRELALPHSLRACWSTPIFTPQGKVIATFAMYFREPRRPTQSHQEIIDQITHLAGVAIQQRIAQERLARSEAYLAEAEKLTHTGSWVWDPRSEKVLHCSEEMFRIFGLDPRVSPPIRENFRQQIHPEDRDWVNQKFEKSLREKVDSFAEYRVLLPDGTVRHINALGHPVLDEDGELIEFVGTAIDVTERKRTELERRRLASLVEQAADLMAIADLSGGTPVYLNKAGLKMVGFDSWEEAKARRGIHYVFPEDRQFVNDVLWPTVLEKGSWSGEMRFRHFKTGDPIPILYSAFRIDDPETGQPVNIGNVCRDITERKRAEEELRASEKRLLDAQVELARVTRVTTLGELTASIAHEVNQPLAAVVNAAGACRRWLGGDTPDLDEAGRALDWITKEANRAGEVIRRIRALAKKTDLERVPLEVNDVVREALALVQRELTSHRVSLRLELASALPSILGDRVQLQQVTINLVMNGLEAMQSVTDRPRELVIQSRQDGTQQVLVSVTDCGVGISAKDADRLFNAFFTTKASGMGMGLSICRSIIEAHSGRLWATANVPHGATFQFTIPWQAAQCAVN